MAKGRSSRKSVDADVAASRCSATVGKMRTELMTDTTRTEDIEVLLDQRLFTLHPERYDAFVHALDNPPGPGPKLKALLGRVPLWER